MKLPLDPAHIVRAGMFALGRPADCTGNGYRLRRSCTHGRHVPCPICHQDVHYHELADGVVEIDRHRSRKAR